MPIATPASGDRSDASCAQASTDSRSDDTSAAPNGTDSRRAILLRRHPQRRVGAELGLRAPRALEERRRRVLGFLRRCFELEEQPLALQPAGVAGELAVPAHDAVARDDDGERVAADGIADLARQRGAAQLDRELAVRRRVPVGDPVDEVPDLPLERVADDGGPQPKLVRSPSKYSTSCCSTCSSRCSERAPHVAGSRLVQ
jgi:hypothetical protein